MKKIMSNNGTSSDNFSIGIGQSSVSLLNDSGLLKFINTITDEYIRVQGAYPTQMNDLTTKEYVDSKDVISLTVAPTYSVTAGDVVEMGTNGIYTSNVGTEVNGVISIGNNIIGIALTDATEGNKCKVAVGPLVNGFSNIVPGTIYYCNSNGKIVSTPTIYRVGIGLTQSTLKLDLRPNIFSTKL